MSIPKDIPQPGQPEIPVHGRRNRPRRPERTLPNYPDSPITIPSERVEAAKDLLGRIHEMWEQGRHYDSLVSWFDIPMDQRDDVINTVLLQEAEPAGRSLRSAQYDMEGKPEHLILKHYALLAAPAVGKIIRPNDNDPINNDDVNELYQNPGGNQEFGRRLMSLGLGYKPYFHDYADFTEPNQDIKRSFSLDETREFLVKLTPYLNVKDRVKGRLLSSGSHGVIDVMKHTDLLTDPRLADILEKPLLREVVWEFYMENYLRQEVFPSAGFFEEAFKRLDPKDSDPNANFHISDKNNTEIPASVFYFTMLRKITLLKSLRERHPEFGKGWEGKITSYLLNDVFMAHVLPYLETENAYEDDFVSKYGNNEKVLATGDEAKALKGKRFGEVINIAVEYARQRGDEETVRKLNEREVGGVKFADFISHR